MGGRSCLDACVVNEGVFRAGAESRAQNRMCRGCIHRRWLNCIIREYGSTLYVGLARAVSPTNTNFRLTFLLT